MISSISTSPSLPSSGGPAPSATFLDVRNVAKRFGSKQVLKNISLQIAGGEFLTLLGETGSWAASQGQPNGRLLLAVHCVRFAAAAAFALGPAFQVAAIERAKGKMRKQAPASDFGPDRLGHAQAV